MALNTIELYKIVESENVELFDFEYELYDNNVKEDFEKYFINYFYFNEIGFETIGRFKKMLQNKLNTIAYKYKEIYKTVLVAENYDFMTTKDMTYTTTRELEGENTTNTSTENNSMYSTKGKNENIYSQTPKGSIDNLEHYMTEGTVDKNNVDSNSQDSMIGNSSTENKQKEIITHVESGNLGAFSDAHLIERWRDIILDINETICRKELSSLFMLIY